MLVTKLSKAQHERVAVILHCTSQLVFEQRITSQDLVGEICVRAPDRCEVWRLSPSRLPQRLCFGVIITACRFSAAAAVSGAVAARDVCLRCAVRQYAEKPCFASTASVEAASSGHCKPSINCCTHSYSAARSADLRTRHQQWS